MRHERDQWRKLAKALDKLLVAYRMGGRRPPYKAIDDAYAAREALMKIEGK